MNASRAGRLTVPGASLYYEMRGSGPVLLMISGGAGDADSYNRLVAYLDDRYTVASYDRRGYSRSPLDEPNQPIEIETHSDDLHRLLAAISSEPAFVFGCSIGALIGLDFAIHHPEQVRVLVAHEPPVGELLPPDDRANERLPEMYSQEGAAAALQKFAAKIGVKHDDPEINVGLPQRNTQVADVNREAFFRYDVGAVARYRLNLTALNSTPVNIVLAGGSSGREFFPYRCAAALAKQIRTEMVEFPGNHAGWVDHSQEFADKLVKTFDLKDNR